MFKLQENISSEESLRNEEQDRDALLDMFMELAQRDQVSKLYKIFNLRVPAIQVSGVEINDE